MPEKITLPTVFLAGSLVGLGWVATRNVLIPLLVLRKTSTMPRQRR